MASILAAAGFRRRCWVSRLAAEAAHRASGSTAGTAEKAREEFETNLYESSLAAIALGEATAKARAAHPGRTL